MSPIRIEYLADCPETVDTLARWHHDEWQHLNPQDTVDRRIERMRKHLGRRQVPATLVAFDSARLAGSASLVKCDLHQHAALSPWLAAVYVDPAHRGQGIGSKLVEHVAAEARLLGHERLYLFTPDREGFYTRLGWRVRERTTFRDYDVVVMELPLTEQAS